MPNARLHEAQAGIKIAGRNINNLRYVDDTTLNCGKFFKRWEYQTIWLASWETYMQVRKQQLELDIEQQTGPK